MTINLTPQQIAWLQQFAAERGLASLDEAAQTVIAQVMLTDEFEEPDPEWVIPLLDEARAELARGEGIPLEEFSRRMDAHMAKLRDK